jgi:hypothetical protein
MFKDNKYTKYYFKIINFSKSRILEPGSYFEKHHILPKSMGGTNHKENIVKLTAREHFICHRLLVKMTSGKEKLKMSYALRCMINRENKHQVRHKINGSSYERIIIETKSIISENSKGDNNPFYGKKHSKETLEKLSKLRIERHKSGILEGMSGKKHTDDSKQKIREASKKQFEDPAQREKIREASKKQFEDPNNRYKAGNGKRGKSWFYNPENGHSILCFPNEMPNNYAKGRKIK